MSKPVVLTDTMIQTGKHFFDYEEPFRSTMTLDDLAHSLSMICRWGGHCDHFFSVGQHVLMVADICATEFNSPIIELIGLHHDDHETLRGDIPSPRKNYLRKHNMLFQGEERAQDKWIFETLVGVDYPIPQEIRDAVKIADIVALQTERQYLKPRVEWSTKYKVDGIKPLSRSVFEVYDSLTPDIVKETYLERHYDLKKELG